MEIIFAMDFVCPFCAVAKEALDRAIKETGLQVHIRRQPYQLTAEGTEQVDTYHDERRRAHFKKLEEPCRELGLELKIPPFVVPRPYTRLAFEGWYFACEEGKGEEYLSAVFDAYFGKEEDIGKTEVLAAAARRAGLEEGAFLAALENGKYAEKAAEADRYSHQVLRVRSVPTLFIDGRRVEVSSYHTADFAAILKEADCRGRLCACSGCAPMMEP